MWKGLKASRRSHQNKIQMLEVLVFRSGCVGELSWFLDGETVNKQFSHFLNDASSSAMLSSDNNTFRTERLDNKSHASFVVCLKKSIRFSHENFVINFNKQQTVT